MPYSREAKYYHHRQKSPKLFIQESFRTVPIFKSGYKGKKYWKEGNLAIVGQNKRTGDWQIQSILEVK